MDEQETWKDVVGFEGIYMVSNKGRIKRLKREVNNGTSKRTLEERIKKQTFDNYGYMKVRLFNNQSSITRQVQRIVAMAFLPNPDGKSQVNHIDGNKTNNNVNNLEWCTAKENREHCLCILKHGVKSVEQYDLHGNFIAKFDSIKEASEKTGTARFSISNVIHGRRYTAGGYVWKLA